MTKPRAFFTQWPSPERRAAIEDLCAVIRTTVPEAVEGLGLPRVFDLDGRPLVSVGGSKQHCSFYVMDQGVMTAFAEELDAAGLRYTKGTVIFHPGKPIPDVLVKRIVKARIRRNRMGRAPS